MEKKITLCEFFPFDVYNKNILPIDKSFSFINIYSELVGSSSNLMMSSVFSLNRRDSPAILRQSSASMGEKVMLFRNYYIKLMYKHKLFILSL